MSLEGTKKERYTSTQAKGEGCGIMLEGGMTVPNSLTGLHNDID